MKENQFPLSAYDQEERLYLFYDLFKSHGLNNVNGLLQFLEVYRQEQKKHCMRGRTGESFDRLSFLIEDAKAGLNILQDRINNFSKLPYKNHKNIKNQEVDIVSQLSEIITQNEQCDCKLKQMNQDISDIKRHLSEESKIYHEQTTQCTEYHSTRQIGIQSPPKSNQSRQKIEKRFSFNINDANDLREFIIYTQSQHNSETNASVQ